MSSKYLNQFIAIYLATYLATYLANYLAIIIMAIVEKTWYMIFYYSNSFVIGSINMYQNGYGFLLL